MPNISIILPCFNHGLYIAQAIEGVLEQTYNDFELIIIDDGSQDKSKQIIEYYARKDKRIIPIFQGTNVGPGAARNAGLKISSGNFIAFCDADDIWEREKLKLQLNILSEFEEYDVVHSDAIIVDSNGNSTGKKFSELFQKDKTLHGNLLNGICLTNFINTQTVLMKRRCFHSVGYFPEDCRVAEDWVYWVKLAKGHNFFYIDLPLAKYRIHKTSSNLDSRAYRESRIIAINDIIKLCPGIKKSILSKLFYKLAMEYYEIRERDKGKEMLMRACKEDIRNIKSLLRLLFPPIR
jgi:glycosyltransferase involved in cell wall biosynthesis